MLAFLGLILQLNRCMNMYGAVDMRDLGIGCGCRPWRPRAKGGGGLGKIIEARLHSLVVLRVFNSICTDR